MIRVERHGPVTFFRLARPFLGRGLYWTGCYLVDGLLVDCGPPVTARELCAALSDERLEALALTHHHEDHTGGAALLGASRGLSPLIHPRGRVLLQQGFEQQAYRRLAWGRRPRLEAGELGPELRTRELRFEVLETPGHSPDHVCLWEPERGLLFTGDLFLAEKLRYLRSDEDLLSLVASLERVVALGARQVFCAHRGLVADGSAALRRKAAHLRELRDAILEGLRRGDDEAALARRLVGPEGFLTYFSLGHFSARNFVRVVAAGRKPPGPPAGSA